MPRHLSAAVLMGLEGSPSRALVTKPSIYLFGVTMVLGFDDIWVLNIEKIQGKAVDDLYTPDNFNGMCLACHAWGRT